MAGGLRKGTRRVADEFVRKEHFEEFCLRMDGQFLALEKRMEQGFAHAEKAREQNLAYVNLRFEAVDQRLGDMNRNIDQRFEAVDQRFDDMNRSMHLRFDSLENRFDDLRKIVLIMLTALAGATVVSVIGAAIKYVFLSG